LSTDPSPTQLRSETDDLRIGVNKGRLLSAYAQMKAGSANYARESELNEKGLSTQADLLASQEMYYSAQAEYMAAYEDIEFSYLLMLQEAKQKALVASSSVDNAERRLHLLGLSQEAVEQIAREADVGIARYELTAPRGGEIVVKHIAPGERVGPEEQIYTIADLSSVWLNIAVYSRYSGAIREGQRVIVRAGDRAASGVVDFVGSIISEASRTANARVVLENSDRVWKPGEFVMVQVETQRAYAKRVVPVDAIQTYEGRHVVFIQDADGIEPVEVSLGRRSGEHVELLGDEIALGTPIVVENSFLIKAELGKGAAGHDH
jgi:cobalt-zinc-cadmium efflux system membrane fusion protein